MPDNVKGRIVDVIRNQSCIKVRYRREEDRRERNLVIAPYDFYTKNKKGSKFEKEVLLGHELDNSFSIKRKSVVAIYLDNIMELTVLNDKFDGGKLRELMKTKRDPYVRRNW
jgi:hypothetical protein